MKQMLRQLESAHYHKCHRYVVSAVLMRPEKKEAQNVSIQSWRNNSSLFTQLYSVFLLFALSTIKLCKFIWSCSNIVFEMKKFTRLNYSIYIRRFLFMLTINNSNFFKNDILIKAVQLMSTVWFNRSFFL